VSGRGVNPRFPSLRRGNTRGPGTIGFREKAVEVALDFLPVGEYAFFTKELRHTPQPPVL
jgi:hypothetical protein